MRIFVSIVDSFSLLTINAKLSILNAWKDPDYVFRAPSYLVLIFQKNNPKNLLAIYPMFQEILCRSQKPDMKKI